MNDGEILILAVEKHPCLWNIDDIRYHNREEKETAWEQVCKEVIKDWNSCNVIDRENKSEYFKIYYCFVYRLLEMCVLQSKRWFLYVCVTCICCRLNAASASRTNSVYLACLR